MRESESGAAGRRHRRGATLLVTTVVGIAALTGGQAAQAAPRDNVQNAMKCLNGGWRTLTTSQGRSFRGVADCIVYALRGGQFGTPPPPPPPPPGE
jgi:hypothetical protein